MTFSVTSDKTTLASFQRKAHELGKRLEIISLLENDIRGLIDLEKGVETQQAKLDEARRAMMSLKARLEGKDIESQSLVTRIAQIQRQLENASGRQQRNEAMNVDMREKADARVQALKGEYLAASKERGAWAKQRVELENQQRALEDDMKAFVARYQAELDELMEEYWTMRGQAGELRYVLCAVCDVRCAMCGV